MARLLFTNPLHHPAAMAIAGAVLVTSVRVFMVSWWLALPLALLAGFTIAHQRRESTPPSLSRRSLQLAQAARHLAYESSQRLSRAEDLGRLSAVQLCCQRVMELPPRLNALQADPAATERSLLSADNLEKRLRHEQRQLLHDRGTALGRQRQRLVQQLERNLRLAQQGVAAGRLWAMAMAELLEGVAGDLQTLQVNLRQPVLPAGLEGMAFNADPRKDPLTEDLVAQLDELDRMLDRRHQA